MDGKQRERAVKLDRRAVARLHAEIIDCADDPHKMSHHSMVEDLREYGVEVTFKQIENALRTLGYKWKEVFLPASNSDRGKKPRQPEAGDLEATQEPASGPDMRAVLNRIEQLEQTLTTWGHAEYRELHRQVHEQAQLATDRAKALIDKMSKLEKELLEKRYAEYAWLVQHSRDEARLAAERSATLRSDIRTLLRLLDQQTQPKQPTQEPQQ
ncbi:MAG: hypothetical protein EBV32_02975 [Proteobacteria bacterium]|uniref:Uncharacterized protein n=1 Tax=Candidatus Fonsibacter lacus TaxID=2576439 RepID=A0A964XS30_9PROT|nr:hypothetical protein [Candidatus Fonsibacter lacus]NCU72148.1 hypothetical protein [Candidatus Fonsibacter lacus]